jgi:hypothetical protein
VFAQKIDPSLKQLPLPGRKQFVPVADQCASLSYRRSAVSRLRIEDVNGCGRHFRQLPTALPQPRGTPTTAGQVNRSEAETRGHTCGIFFFIIEKVVDIKTKLGKLPAKLSKPYKTRVTRDTPSGHKGVTYAARNH